MEQLLTKTTKSVIVRHDLSNAKTFYLERIVKLEPPPTHSSSTTTTTTNLSTTTTTLPTKTTTKSSKDATKVGQYTHPYQQQQFLLQQQQLELDHQQKLSGFFLYFKIDAIILGRRFSIIWYLANFWDCI